MPNNRKPVSIKEIAMLSGFSIATVSRVINQKGKYSLETERIIQDIIRDTHYLPNMVAKGLKTNQIQTVAIIVPDIRDEFYARITMAAQEELFQHSYSAFICNSNEKESVESRHIDMMRAQNIDALIFICSEKTYEGDYKHVPKVYVDRLPPQSKSNGQHILIEANNFVGGRLAAKELLDCGADRLLMISREDSISSHLARQHGFETEMKKRGKSACYDIIRMDNSTPREVYKRISCMIEEKRFKYDGLFCNTDPVAIGAIDALLDAGIAVPEEVQVVGYDDMSLSAYFRPALTSIRQPCEELGRKAAALILSQLAKEPVAMKVYQLPVQLIKRQSTKRSSESTIK